MVKRPRKKEAGSEIRSPSKKRRKTDSNREEKKKAKKGKEYV